jgi:heme exporter protein A
MAHEIQEPLPNHPAVSLEGISKSFDTHVVLEGICLQLTAGRGLCICGPNAAGKSTLLRIMAGLLRPAAGTVQICGFDLDRQPEQARSRLGAIFHKSMVYQQLTVLENLRFFARLYGLKDQGARIEQLLTQTALTRYRHDPAGILSRGMTQRLAIARALLHTPRVLLADEPFTGLDLDAGRHLVEILTDFKQAGGSLIMTTHNVALALTCCEHVAVLDNRRLVLNADVGEIDVEKFTRDYLAYAREYN